jgi:hypothetical protein
MKKIVWNLLIGLSCLVLSACGGGGGGGSGESSSGSSSGNGTNSNPIATVTPPSTGVFLDSAVENIGYKTQTLRGYTNASGEFKYAVGETVTFFIGSIDLPSVTAGAQITPADLARNSSSPINTLTNLLVLLQSLDTDGDPSNGIKLSEASKSTPTSTLVFTSDPAQFFQSTALRTLLQSANADHTTPVDPQVALNNFLASNPTKKAVAVAKTSGAAVVGNTITLNASDSFDGSGAALTAYKWSVTTNPAYSTETIKNPSTAIASLSIDVAGDYAVQLSVTNASGISGTTAINIKGVANPKFGASILTLYATKTGLNVSCAGQDTTCNKRLASLIHTEKLGCVTCDSGQTDSICNINGEFGSLTGSRSIWNTSSNQYGNDSNLSSPWNASLNDDPDQGKILRITPLLRTAFTDVVDERAIAFTLNSRNFWLGPFLPDTTNEPLLLDMLAAYTSAEASASAKRDAVCRVLSQAFQ